MTNRQFKFLHVFLALLTAMGAAGSALAQPPSLKEVTVPRPDNLGLYVKDEAAAVRLGKALFWDMQVGSDGMTACATCHFHAGTDARTRNTLAPGPNGEFDVKADSNKALEAADFPFHEMVDPFDRGSGGTLADDPAVLRSRDDAVAAQGVPLTRFEGLRAGQAVESGRTLRSGHDGRTGRNLRQTTARNAPTVINAVFNYANFWDGRANHFFNGVDPFGIQNVDARVWDNSSGSLAEFDMTLPANRLDNASLASQAVGPPLASNEMSWVGRSFPDLGRKLLGLRPLAAQQVHPTDSVLGSLAHPGGRGLDTTYAELIRAAFQDRFWNNTGETTAAGYAQMEANFSLFFGLAVMAYEATLVSDDSPFDRFVEGDPTALTERQQRGMNRFLSGQTKCALCHIGAEFTGATVSALLDPLEPALIEVMAMGDGGIARYDIGFYNIGVAPTGNDVGRGGADPFGNPLSFAHQSLMADGLTPNTLTFPTADVPTAGCVPDFVNDPPTICPPSLSEVTRVAADGAFKTPTLRNIELTGPYMHNGGMLTLAQVIDFYVRGGNFREANMADLDPFIDDINGLKDADKAPEHNELVDFLLALTDERVRQESAPFDHPQLFVPDGHTGRISGHPKRSRLLADNLLEVPAVGSAGRAAQGLPPLKPFGAGDLEGQALRNFHFE